MIANNQNLDFHQIWHQFGKILPILRIDTFFG